MEVDTTGTKDSGERMDAEFEKKLKTGTTTLGIVYKDGVLLAADTQSTAGYVESRMERKIHQITDSIALTTAGVVGDIQAILRFLKSEAKLYQMNNGGLTAKGLVTLLSNVLHGNRMFPFITSILIGGFNGKSELFAVDPFGGVGSGEKFFVTGSGGPLAMGVLESTYSDNMTEKEAAKLAIRAVSTAQERDIYSGGKKIIVAVIDKNGYREL
ncbi:MAG: proteasome subunit beta [Candidatus Altiarchaeota archaeon]|nr:proteasome subunit beta [Candidatus Altiarchaeota archaeon]